MLVELMSGPACLGWERAGNHDGRRLTHGRERGEGKEGKVAREGGGGDARGKLHVLLPVERGREGTGGSAVAALTNGKAEGEEEEEEVGSRKPRRTDGVKDGRTRRTDAKCDAAGRGGSKEQGRRRRRRHLDQVRPRLDWSDCSVLLSKGSGERTAAACRMAHKTSRVVRILHSSVSFSAPSGTFARKNFKTAVPRPRVRMRARRT